MYNEDRKENYIEGKKATTTLSPGYLERLFVNSEPFEEKYGKDISNFTTLEIVDFYKTLNVTSIDYLYLINNSYSQYTQWCFEHGWVIDNQNHYLEMNRDVLGKCVNKFVLQKRFVTKEEVYKWCDILPNYSDGFIILSTYEGIGGKDYREIVNARFSDFHKCENDSKYYFHTCEGRDVAVSNKLVGLAESSSEATVRYTPKGGEVKLPISKGRPDLIVKPFGNAKDETNDFEKGRRIYTNIIRSFKYLGIEKYMSPNALSDSGKVRFMKDLSEKYNIPIDKVLYDTKAEEEFSKQYKINIRTRKQFINKLSIYFDMV